MFTTFVFQDIDGSSLKEVTEISVRFLQFLCNTMGPFLVTYLLNFSLITGPRRSVSGMFNYDDESDDDKQGKLPDLDVVEISSDSDLERSMVELEAAVSLEFSDTD